VNRSIAIAKLIKFEYDKRLSPERKLH